MENDIQKITHCPICNAIEISDYGLKDKYLLSRCSACGIVFLNPIPHSVEHIYDTSYFHGATDGHGYVDYDADKEAMRDVFIEYLKMFEAKTLGRSIYDIGAATGYFLDLARMRTWQVAGLEISDFAASAARAKGIPVLTGTISTIPAGEVYDVITMFDVLEHLITPVADMEKVATLVKKGGLVVINTPDIGSLYARILRMSWHLVVPPEHIFYFNKKSIEILLKQTGFEIETYTKIGKKFTLEYIVHTLLRWRKSRVWEKILIFLMRHPKLAQFSIPINLRDNMFVIARKVI